MYASGGHWVLLHEIIGQLNLVLGILFLFHRLLSIVSARVYLGGRCRILRRG